MYHSPVDVERGGEKNLKRGRCDAASSRISGRSREGKKERPEKEKKNGSPSPPYIL